MMATIPMVSLESDEVRPYLRAAGMGDEAARVELGGLFAGPDWQPPYECFACSRQFEEQPGVMIIPDGGRGRGFYVAVGLCHNPCFALPEMYRLGRVLKAAKVIWRAYHFELSPARRIRP
jgi:hypothetical protein